MTNQSFENARCEARKAYQRFCVFTVVLLVPGLLWAREPSKPSAWSVDYANSRIGFQVDSRLGTVDGVFHRWKFDGSISKELEATGKIIVDVSSIDTYNKKRNNHLRDPDFFEVEKYPTAEFILTKVEKRSSYFLVTGKLKVRDKERDIRFKLKKVKENADTMQLKSLFILDRTDFGLTYNSIINPMEDEIVMKVYLTLHKKK